MTDPKHDPDEKVIIPLDPEEALRALLAVDPGDEPADNVENNPADNDS